MATAVLVDRKVEVGRTLLRHLDEAGFPASAAFWAYRDESEAWELKIASPLVDSEGPGAVYARIQPVLRASPVWPKGLQLYDISVVSPKDRLVKALTSRFGTGPDVEDTEASPFYGDGVHSEGVYIYRLE